MKKKIVRFFLVSALFTIMLFLGSLFFDLVDQKESDLVREIKEALVVGVLSGFFLVLLTSFFTNSDKK